MFAFITGSRAYGNVKPFSDIDLVVRVDEATAQKLRNLSDTPQKNECGYVVARFGRLNLILCETDVQFSIWKLGTEGLVYQKKPSDKVVAKETFDVLRRIVGLPDAGDSRD